MNFIGEGPHVTTINFVPTSGGKPAFHWSSGAAVNYESEISNMTISSTNTTLQKIGVRLSDVSKFRSHDMVIGPTFSGNTSIGLQIRGRELGRIENWTINTNQPISIESNPNTAGIIDLDLWHFSDIYTLATGSNPHWKFESGVQVTDFVLSGANIGTSWGTGSGDYINWVDDAGAAVAFSDGFTVRNARLEGTTGGTSYFANIRKSGGGLRSVVFDGCHLGSENRTKGWFLRGVSRITILNSFYAGTIESFNCDSTCDQLMFLNSWSDGTMTMAGMRQVFAFGRPGSSPEPIYGFEFWSSTSNGNNAFQLGGVAFANFPTAPDGTMFYCSDCTITNPCKGPAFGGTGAFAKKLNGVWVCN